MQVEIRFCSMCGYGPKALNLAGLVLEKFKRKLAAVTLVPDSGGCFEVTAGGELIYSKLATDEFPDEQTVLDDIVARLPAK